MTVRRSTSASTPMSRERVMRGAGRAGGGGGGKGMDY